MAIICLGEVIVSGNPNDLVDAMQGKVWRKSIDKSELTAYRNSFQVISTQLVAGKTQIHVISDVQPATERLQLLLLLRARARACNQCERTRCGDEQRRATQAAVGHGGVSD
jgi:hypothetical protein